MKGLVVDASIVLSWYFADEESPPPSIVERLINEPVVVPIHFESELANGIVAGERRGRSLPAQAGELLTFIRHLSPEPDGTGAADALQRILPLARAHALTVYDALYLELAERRGLPLATRDNPLMRAAKKAGVEVLAG